MVCSLPSSSSDKLSNHSLCPCVILLALPLSFVLPSLLFFACCLRSVFAFLDRSSGVSCFPPFMVVCLSCLRLLPFPFLFSCLFCCFAPASLLNCCFLRSSAFVLLSCLLLACDFGEMMGTGSFLSLHCCETEFRLLRDAWPARSPLSLCL